MNRVKRIILILSMIALSGVFTSWIYPEHRSIGIEAIRKLSPQQRAVLDKMWAEARVGYENRLTVSVIDISQTTKPTQLDFASWMGIAGDHSCSPSDMLDFVLNADWILKVADITARLKINLEKAKTNSEIANYLRDSDIRLQRADVDYATRAGSNTVHFLMSRHKVNEDFRKYLAECCKQGADLNALGVYARFHQLALAKAAAYATLSFTPEQRSSLILAALADEAFSLHFLEDAFAAGHITGSWGKSSLKKGTHDYYNEKGLDVNSWEENEMVVRGDAYMMPHDQEVAASTIKLSLEQLISAATGEFEIHPDLLHDLSFAPDTFNVCRNNLMPDAKIDTSLVANTLLTTPIPGLKSGYGEHPRFSAELGPFVGFSASLNGATINGGFGKDQTQKGAVGGLEANIMFGLGLEGVLNQAGDGLVFLQLGWRQDSPSSNQFLSQNINFPVNSITSVIPGRSAYNIRLRLPFWLIPGDLIVAAPILGIFAPKTLQKMAVVAGNGGLIPWQSGMATGIGRFQFILGREVGVSFFGVGKTADALLIPVSSNDIYLLTYRAAMFDFPFVEYRPFRSFSMNQTSDIKVQFSVGLDKPFKTQIISPSNPNPIDLKSVWNISMRILFDWRHYF